MIYIHNASVWTMVGQDYENGCILIENGKIKAVGEQLQAPAGARVIDGQGGVVMPGMIDAHCHIGIFGEGTGFYLMDGNENSNPSTPQMRAIDAVNPQDMAFREALEGGVTTVCTGPGSTNVIGGTFAILKTYGQSVEEMALVKECAVKAAFGENPKRVYGAMKKEPYTRMGSAAIFRREMQRALEYRQSKRDTEAGLCQAPAYDFALENLVRVLDGELPLKIHAHRADDICTAMRLVKEFGVNCTLDHCTEGYKIADQLKAFDAKVLVGPMILDRCKAELAGSHTDNVVRIAEAGNRFCIVTDSPCVNVKHLFVQAGYAVSLGLDKIEARKAITLYPAQLLGIDDRVGSIAPGKDADLVLLTGDLFDMESKIKAVMVNGEVVYQNELLF